MDHHPRAGAKNPSFDARVVLLMAALLLSLAAGVQSQPPDGQAQTGGVKAGERLRISIVGLMAPGVETRLTRLVEPDGTLRLPKLAGRPVDPRGMTAASLEAAILRAYQEQVVLPLPTMVVVSRLDAGEDHALEAWREPPAPQGHAGFVVRGMVAPWPEALVRPLDGPIEVAEVPLEDVLALLSQRIGLAISTNWSSLELEGVDRQSEITLRVDAGVPGARVLEMVLENAGGGFAELQYEWLDGVLMVSTGEALAKHVQTSVIDLGPVIDGIDPGPAREELVEDIIELITETVLPDAWRENGGDIGTIQEIEGRLAITATPRMHREIISLLEKLSH